MRNVAEIDGIEAHGCKFALDANIVVAVVDVSLADGLRLFSRFV